MNYKKVILVIVSILFFLAALTFYLNRVILPKIVKKIVVQRLEETLHRQVEIDSLHFNWVRGFIIDKIIIHERSSNAIFAQAQQVNFGLLFFPGNKHMRVTVPFIHVNSPSIHLIRKDQNTWNFSDLLASAFQTNTSSSSATPTTNNTPNFEIAWGGLTITNGKLLLDDLSQNPHWSEYFDNINLKLSLSYQGISYDFTTDIPQSHGLIGATVYYEPLTKNTRAQIHLKNIDTASYLSLINIPELNLKSGIIEDIDLDMEHSQEKTTAQGNVLIKNLDINNNQGSFHGDIEIHGLNARYQDGDIYARGEMSLLHMQTSVEGLAARGSVQANVGNFEFTKDGVNFNGSFRAQDASLDLQDRHIKVHQANIQHVQVIKTSNGIESVGSIDVQGLLVTWPNQKFQGDFSLKDLTMHMVDENNIHLTGSFQADHLLTNFGDKNIISQQLIFKDASLSILNQQNIYLNTQISLDNTTLDLGENLTLSTTAESNNLSFKLENGLVNLSTTLNTSASRIVLNQNKTITGSPQLELHLSMPLNDPSQMTYKGSITLSDGTIQGFSPIRSLNNIELDADFQNDQMTINALNTTLLDTTVHITGNVQDFKDPTLDIIAEAQDLNLAKIKDLAFELINQLGLEFNGTSFVKVKFQGKLRDPLSGNILAVASVKNVSVTSSKLHQEITNITGILEATPDSLKWRDTTATWMGKKYSLAGHLNNFKNPKIFFNLDGPNMQLKGQLTKNNNLISIEALSGKYFDAAFNVNGTVALTPGEAPFINLNTNASLLLENLAPFLPSTQKGYLLTLKPSGSIDLSAEIKGQALDWRNYAVNANISSPVVTMLGYNLKNIKINIKQDEGKIEQLLFDGEFYGGSVHAVGSMDLINHSMPYELALNIDGTDLHQLKMDTPLKMEEIDGKLYFTTLAHGNMADFKNSLQATGSMAIRDGFLGEFNFFKGLLSILNDMMQISQVMITDVEGNFTIAKQRMSTDNLRLKGPTIVLLSKGWVDFDQMCDLNVTVDLSSGTVPAIAHDVLNTVNIHIYDKISNPKFKKKISVPQVINTLLKNLWQ